MHYYVGALAVVLLELVLYVRSPLVSEDNRRIVRQVDVHLDSDGRAY